VSDTVIVIPERTDDRAFLPDNLTVGGSGGVRVVSCEVRTCPGKNENGESYLDIGVLVPSDQNPQGTGSVFVHTAPFGANHAKLTANSGSKVGLFSKQLGAIGGQLDPNQVLNKEVIITVTLRTYERDGVTQYANNISNIALR
jgi:hypothetical protein